MSPRELREEINVSGKAMKVDLNRCQKKANTITSHIKPELLEELEKIRRGK